jgi:DNA modification methylase
MAQRMNNLSGKEWLTHSFSIWRDIRKSKEETSLKHPALFPMQLVERFIEIYTREDGEKVLDPFLGIGTTLLAARNTSRAGIGCELNESYAEMARERLAKQQGELFGEDKLEFEQTILVGDNRETLKQLESESIDLSVSSPPYWDILSQKRTADYKEINKYSDSETDIGNISDYNEFLNNLKQVYSEVFRVLKPNKRCVVNVMDLRKKDKFFPLHMDLSRVMTEIGFELEDFLIWDRQHEYNNMKTLGYPWVFRVNKVHEFLCVFWKREEKQPKSATTKK